MKLIKSYFSKQAFKSNFIVNLQMLITLNFFFIILYIILFQAGFFYIGSQIEPIKLYEETLLQLNSFAMGIIGAIIAIVIASIQFNYLMFKKSAVSVHCLPQSRAQIFTAKYITVGFIYLTGLITFTFSCQIFLFPHFTVQAFLTAIYFVLNSFAVFMFYYSLACLLHIISGVFFIAPLLYASLFALLPLSALILFESFTGFLPLYSMNIDSFLGALLNSVSIAQLGANISEFSDIGISDTLRVFVIIVISLLIYTISIIAYTKRNIENTGQFLMFNFAKYILSIIISLLCSVTVAVSIKYRLSIGYNLSSLSTPQLILTLVLAFVTAVLTYFVALSILSNFSFKIFSKTTLLQSIGAGVLISAFIIVLQMGGLGYSSYVPKADDIEFMSLRTSFYSNNIELLGINQHTAELKENEEAPLLFTQDEQKNDILRFHEDYLQNGMYLDVNKSDVLHYSWLTLTYTLKNGDIVNRKFVLPHTEEIMQNEGSAQNILNNFAEQNITISAIEKALKESTFWLDVIPVGQGEYASYESIYVQGENVPGDFFETVFLEIEAQSEGDYKFTTYAPISELNGNSENDELALKSNIIANIYIYAKNENISFTVAIDVSEDMVNTLEMLDEIAAGQ